MRGPSLRPYLLALLAAAGAASCAPRGAPPAARETPGRAVTVDDAGMPPGHPPPPVGEPTPSDDRVGRAPRRLSVDQLRASLLAVTGYSWIARRRVSDPDRPGGVGDDPDADMLEALAPTLGRADYVNTTSDSIEPAVTFAKLASDAAELVALGGESGRREALVRTRSGAVQRVRFAGGASPTATWIEVAPGVELGAVRAVAAMDDERGVVAGERGVLVTAPDALRLFRADASRGVPDAIAGGGGWAWVAWGGSILRTDGERWEALVHDAAIAAGTRLAVDRATGAAALVVDAQGSLVRIEAEPLLWLSGLTDEAFVQDTRLPLEPVRTADLRDVTYRLDGQMLVTRAEPPWGWADDGGRVRDLGRLPFGAHTVEVVATQPSGPVLRRTLRFDYVSPLGRVPSYASDVAPLFAARCAHCHGHGVARELGSYEALRALAPAVRASIREARMPPDVLLDAPSAAVFTAWVDGDTPP